MTATLHQSDELLELYALGRLPDPASADVEEHLLVCDICRERLDESTAFAVAMRAAITDEPLDTAPVGWLRRFHLSNLPFGRAFAPFFAGGIAAAALLAVLYLYPGRPVAPLASLELTAMRGNMSSVKSARETDILLADAPSGPGTQAQIVDAAGGTVWNAIPEGDRHRLRITKQLAAGSYFVRLYDSAGNLLHEYGFQVQAP